jgi:hypothetical protein
VRAALFGALPLSRRWQHAAMTPNPVRTWRTRALAALLAALLCAPTAARGPEPVASLRAQEAASCLPGEQRLWPDGRDRPDGVAAVHIVYRHAGAPRGFDEGTVLAALQRAARAWSACGIPAQVIGEEAATLEVTPPVVVLWSEAESRGQFALANLTHRRLAMSAAMYTLLAQRNPAHPAVQTLQMTLSHELGHFYGLVAHSRRCIDVMSYYTDAAGQTCSTRDGRSYKSAPEYRALLPTACDIARCQAINGTAR